MTIPLYSLLGFAAWTLAVLMFGVGIERSSLILRGEAGLADFPADEPHGRPLYRRAMRAHANCVENLPVFGAIVLVAWASGASGTTFDVLSPTLLVARVGQTSVHVIFEPTNRTVGVRFSFFAVQLLCMLVMLVLLALDIDVPLGRHV